MPAFYLKSAPRISKSLETKEITVEHNHCSTIDYNRYDREESKELNQAIDQNIVALKGCITFFKTFAEAKDTDIEFRAVAVSTVAEDEARLEDFANHKRSKCVIL